ncbi:MAG: hypothetical protein ACK42D_02820 [Candidatus Paceibacteria bacterium]
MEQLPKSERIGQEMLTERFNWLLKHDESNQLRLLAQAMTESGYSDIIEFIYEDTKRLRYVADLFNLNEDILFGRSYVTESEFMRKVEDFRAGK